MPTAARLFAAIAFSALAMFAAESFKPLMPEGTNFGMFTPVSMLIGLICGWLVAGRLAGHGYRPSIGGGIRTSLAIVFWAMVIFSLEEMVVMATRRAYDGPMDALIGAVSIMTEFGALLLHPVMVGLLLIGGALGGAMAEWAARRWS